MMLTVSQVSKKTGVSVRTLHHYDKIGLLTPSTVSESGYRLYDDTALERLQNILMLKELQFSLKDIASILNNKSFDMQEAIDDQINILQAEYEHIGQLIEYAKKIKKGGNTIMDFKAFNTDNIEQYKNEAKQRWGQTDAYKEFEQKSKKYTEKDYTKLSEDMMQLFVKIGECKALATDDEKVMTLIAQLQQFISDNYYNCTNDILLSLGQMYTSDERFTKNIDSMGGEGTAAFCEKAITAYCKKK